MGNYVAEVICVDDNDDDDGIEVVKMILNVSVIVRTPYIRKKVSNIYQYADNKNV